ncbi:MAG TPA: GNAT family N-acetyltransferase [Anaerolineae bacterium]|nr:GNAT family N-acetyltransferase [Anaerolineae bacterium]HQH37919.1 GNAT family N-acetyltransferase [Anaerolineae bacterium]
MTCGIDTWEDEATEPVLRRAVEFTIEQLVDAYNQTRVGYIVPMPMNAQHLSEYIHNYDVKLEYSAVALSDGQIRGLVLLGVRSGRCWSTRLGVLPAQRRHGMGEWLMRDNIRMSQALGAKCIVLEVINGNEPAHQLFVKLGFRETRVLLILHRPPHPPQADEMGGYRVTFLDADDAVALLAQRRSTPSWLDETPSLVNAGNLAALQVELSDGGRGWLVYQNTISQLGRLVLQTEAGDPREVARTLVHALHCKYPVKDTNTENLPLDDPHLPGLLDMGYIEVFRRIEMRLDLQ